MTTTLRPFLAPLVMLLAFATQADAAAPPKELKGVISWPTETERGRKLYPDADTPRIKVCRGKYCELIKVRLRSADSPEVSHSRNEPDQPYGRESLAYAKSHWQGRTVIASVRGDSYGRPIVDIKDKDGNDLAADLVAHGWAAADPRYSSNNLKVIEAEAMQKKLGMWAQEKPEMPWDFRARMKEEKRNKRM